MTKKLLLISNSTMAGGEYLGWPRQNIKEFLDGTDAKKVLFIPYAGVGLAAESVEKSFDVYEKKVKKVYQEIGYELYSIHKEADPVKAVEEAEAIAVGGGNTFHLVMMLHKLKLVEPIRKHCEDGMPFMGWSAGANVACPTMKTTNDMPISEPESFTTFNLIPFQINPHYLDAHAQGHAGETREQRIDEFTKANHDMYVVGLREGCLLEVCGDELKLIGPHPIRLFKYGEEFRDISKMESIQFLMKG